MSDLDWLPIFAVLPGVFAIGLGIKGYRHYAGAKASLRWRPVEGTITHSEIQSSLAGRQMRYAPNIRYTYKAAGKEYEGWRVFFGSEDFYPANQERASELVPRYPVGARVIVYVDPTRHSEAVLLPGEVELAERTLLTAFGFGATAIIFAYGLWFA